MNRPTVTKEAVFQTLRQAVPRPAWMRWRAGSRQVHARWARCSEVRGPDLVATGPNSSSRACALLIAEAGCLILAEAGYSPAEIATLQISFVAHPPGATP